jgi:hypothetical protein
VFGHLDPSAGFMSWSAITIVSWAVPLIVLVWPIRSVNAMVVAQRQVADHLRLIADDIRARASGPTQH